MHPHSGRRRIQTRALGKNLLHPAAQSLDETGIQGLLAGGVVIMRRGLAMGLRDRGKQ